MRQVSFIYFEKIFKKFSQKKMSKNTDIEVNVKK